MPLRLIKALVIGVLLCGCQTARQRQLQATACYDNGNPGAALAMLEKAEAVPGAEEQLIRIDKALVALMQANPSQCEAELRETRKIIDHLQQKDLREQTAAVLTDDKAAAWTGREVERRMVDNILILCSLLGNQQDAFAYATQAMDRVHDDRTGLSPPMGSRATVTVGHTTEVIPPTAPSRMAANALSAYLHAAAHSELAMDADLTDRSLRQVSYWQGVPPKQGDRIAVGTNSRKGHGVLHVITFVGRITDWQPERAEPTSTALLLADRLLSAIGDHTLPPTIAPVTIARPTCDHSQTSFVTAAETAAIPGTLTRGRTIVDLNQAMWDSYLHDRNQQIARAIVRRVAKKSAVYAAKDGLSVSKNSGVDLLLNVGGIAWEALEKPDTRHVSLLPERVEVLQMELPVGDHHLNLRAVADANGQAASSDQTSVNVHIADGQNTYVLCYRRDARFSAVLPGNRF